MTRLFLAAGVAALAIAGAADAKPGGGGGNPHGGGGQREQHGGGGGGGHGGGGGAPQSQGFRGGGGGHGGGGGFQQQAFRGGGGAHGGGGGFQQQAFRGGGGGGHGHGGGFEAPQGFAMQRQHGGGQAFQRQERQQFHVERQAQNRNFERQQLRGERQAQNRSFERQQMRMQRQAENRGFERQQMKAQREAQNRFERQNFDGRQFREAQNGFNREQMRAERMQQRQQLRAFADQRFEPRFVGRDRFEVNNREFWRNQQVAYRQALAGTSFAPLYYGAGATVLAPTIVNRFIGVPVNNVASFASLNPFPASLDYLYPTTADYYYRYGDGYAYQINRGSNLIAAMIPLLAGGYLPGQYLPQPYMTSYVPDYYGFNSFYPDYGGTCNRYANGVVYEVDCASGFVEDVIPLYASGYGVGQVLPSSYAYYNVPYQYRSLYYDTPDYNYWYAPGAIYQYEPHTSMITSVAALLSPGFTVGQALPVGYDVYNVPYSYRATYYDTPNAWYRYNNGYIYQVDPVTRLVTAIVASILT